MRDQIVDVYDFIYNISYNMLECHHHAQDITQHIYLQYNKKLEENPKMDESYKRFWVIRATKNKCLNHIRNNKRLSLTDPADFMWMTELSHNPSETLEIEEENEILIDKLKTKISRLPNSQIELLDLKYNKELSYNEIIKLTGYSLPKVKSMMNRAITNLKKMMNVK